MPKKAYLNYSYTKDCPGTSVQEAHSGDIVVIVGMLDISIVIQSVQPITLNQWNTLKLKNQLYL